MRFVSTSILVAGLALITWGCGEQGPQPGGTDMPEGMRQQPGTEPDQPGGYGQPQDQPSGLGQPQEQNQPGGFGQPQDQPGQPGGQFNEQQDQPPRTPSPGTDLPSLDSDSEDSGPDEGS